MFALANLAIARQHVERDIVTANPSVRPSVRHTLVLYLCEYTYRQTLSAVW